MSPRVSTRSRGSESVVDSEMEALQARLREAEDTLRALQLGEADAVVVQGPGGPRVYTLVTPDESYRTLVEQMSEGALILSTEGRIVYANGRISELVGDPTPAGRLLNELAVPEDGHLVEELLKLAATDDAAREVRFAPGSGGEGVPVQLSISALRTGGFSGLVAVVTDLTEAKRREKSAERQRLTSAVLDFAGTAILVCDAQGTVVRANREGIAICCDEPIGRRFEEVLPIGVTYRALLESTTTGPLDVTLRRPRGDDRFLFVSSRRIDDGRLQDSWWVVTLVDVTDRRRAEEGLRRAMEAAESANRAKSDFLSVMSHELRTPLNSVIGYSDLLLMRVDGDLSTEQESKIERIQLSAKLQLSLIEEVLAYARIEGGHEHLELASVDVFRVVQDVAELVQPEAARKGLIFSVTCPPESELHIVTDVAKLRRVLINLAANATKFTRRGRVEIQAGLEDGWLALTVSDTGPGIPEEHLEKIWEPFTQVDPSPTRASPGTGLGLAIVKRLVDIMGGEVAVTTALGQGTTFRVRLPSL